MHRVRYFPKFHVLILILRDLSRLEWSGLPVTDLVGTESVGIFWSLIEMGIAIPVACLPTLRPMFHGLSRESIISSIRDMISLSAMFSDKKKIHQGSYDLKSKTGNFEMRSEAPGSHKIGLVEPRGSWEENPFATPV